MYCTHIALVVFNTYKFRHPPTTYQACLQTYKVLIQALKFLFTSQSCFHLGFRICQATLRGSSLPIKCKKILNIVKCLRS